jgi:hypothetical protein
MGKSAGGSGAGWGRTCTCAKTYDDGIYNSSALALSVLGQPGGGGRSGCWARGSPSVFEAQDARLRPARVGESKPGTFCVRVCRSIARLLDPGPCRPSKGVRGRTCFVINHQSSIITVPLAVGRQHQHETRAYGSRGTADVGSCRRGAASISSNMNMRGTPAALAIGHAFPVCIDAFHPYPFLLSFLPKIKHNKKNPTHGYPARPNVYSVLTKLVAGYSKLAWPRDHSRLLA